MQIKTLYRYTRPDGGVTVSPVLPDVPYSILYRVIADPGKLLTRNGSEPTGCVDTDSPDGWTEIADPEESDSEQMAQRIAELEAINADQGAALDVIFNGGDS